MKTLLDTSALAEIKKPKPDPAILAAFSTIKSDLLFISALTVGEITKGISLLPASRKRQDLTAWLAGIESDFQDRILPIDADTARIWGELTARLQKRGIILPAVDGLLAATALRHGLHILTRNMRDFQPTGALLINPWARS